MDPKSPEFKKLQREWYRKLKKSGFEDAEQDEVNLNQWSTYIKHRHTPSEFQAQQEYFQLAGQFLHNYRFLDDRDKQIWTLHSEGLTISEICKVITDPRKSKSTVRNVVTRLKKIMLLGLESG